MLADFGSFYVSGRRVEINGQAARDIQFTPSAQYRYDPNGTFFIEQAYIQYFIPQQRRFVLPLLLIHGGGLSGACWETTPDGRPGWLRRLIEFGAAVYVIDNVERGRASWCALPGQWPGEPIMRSIQEAWTLFRIGRAENFTTRIAFPGQQFPVAHLETFALQFIPRWLSTSGAQLDALRAAIQRIGPCVLVCHSQGGDLGLAAAVAEPDKVRGVAALEPSGFPDFADSAYTDQRPYLFMLGDYMAELPLWARLAERARATAARLNQLGAKARLLALPETGIGGNSHMLMMDRNSDRIAALLQDWLVESFDE